MYTLRELRRSDLPEVNQWRANRAQVDCLGAPFRYIAPEVDDAWFDAYLRERSSTVRCAIVAANDPVAILGLATLSGIDWIRRSATFHVQVAPSAQGRGVGKFALSEMLRHAFCDLGLHRVELGVLATNDRARRLYEEAGFVLEGTRRQAAFKNGRYADVYMMGLLVDEWKAAIESTQRELQQ